MRQTLLISLGLLALLLAAALLWVRLAPSDPARWHADPATTPDPSTPNFARADRLVALPLPQVAAHIAAAARSEGAQILAEGEGLTTWIARTRRLRFPDYVNIHLRPEGDSTRILALSRSRFGYGDRGVNAARLRRWLPD